MARKFLLLNASNYPRNAVFPYAFVQVSALARRAGLETARADLLLYPKHSWPRRIRKLISEIQPDLVGVHLRQRDSQFVEEYDESVFPSGDLNKYLPLEDTRQVIALVRQETDSPIVIGGFGVTNDPIEVFEYLRADFAVEGEPDAFFAQIEDLLKGDEFGAQDVPNVIRRVSGDIRRGPRSFFPPNKDREYTDEILSEIGDFYRNIKRSVSLYKIGEADIPVEISRGCPYHCGFCTEPHVKGRHTRYRDLDTIIDELDFLVSRGVRSVWFVCSELNIGNSDFAMELAKRIIHFNEQLQEGSIVWKAYSLPRPVLKETEWDTLAKSGYIPGWNGVTSFCDENLRRMRVPYRSSDALRYMKNVVRIAPEILDRTGSAIMKSEVFLGNVHSTPDTVRKSLRVIGQSGVFDGYSHKEIIKATRIYRSMLPSLEPTVESCARRFGPEGQSEIYLAPTFAYPPRLVSHFGSSAEVCRFFSYLEESVFSRPAHGLDFAHRLLRNYVPADLLVSVLREKTPYLIYAEALEALLEAEDDVVDASELRRQVLSQTSAILKSPTIGEIQRLYHAPDVIDFEVADLVVRAVRTMAAPVFARLLSALEINAEDYLAGRYTQYNLIVAIHRRISTLKDFEESILPIFPVEKRPTAQFEFLRLIAFHRVELDPKFAVMFVGEPIANA